MTVVRFPNAREKREKVRHGLFPEILPGDWPCAVGFGSVQLQADGRLIWSGDDEETTVDWLRCFYVREISRAKHVTLTFDAPLYEPVYEYDHQRRQFKLVKIGEGFA